MKSGILSLSVGILLIAGLLNSVSAFGQDRNMESRTFEMGNFTKLFLEGAYGVELIQGSTPSVEVRVTDAKAFDYLNFSNEGGLLHLHVDRKPFDFSRIIISVTFDRLTWLRVYGSIKLETRGYLEFKNIEVLLEGGAKVKLQAKANEIYVENKGGVLVELLGVTDILNMRLAGAGHINAGELKAREVDFIIEGVGTGKVYATQTLNATIKGAGKINYLGDPEVNENIEGLGSVRRE